ncbi:MAG: SDR family NAD(P)-dependent oxidoreductase [Pseudomonadota bacterium]
MLMRAEQQISTPHVSGDASQAPRSVSASKPLSGQHVLLTGVSGGVGVDAARALAEQGATLTLDVAADRALHQAIGEMLVVTGATVTLHHHAFSGRHDAMAFARSVCARGRLDAVFNFTQVEAEADNTWATSTDVDDLVAAALSPAFAITQVVANRMALTWREGLIVNVLSSEGPLDAHQRLAFATAKQALAALTRDQACAWADDAVRINAVAPRTTLNPGFAADHSKAASAADIAALLLELATSGSRLTGHMLDAEGAALRCAIA